PAGAWAGCRAAATPPAAKIPRITETGRLVMVWASLPVNNTLERHPEFHGKQYTAVYVFVIQGGTAVLKQVSAIAISLTFLSGQAMAQDAAAVIASAQKALGDVKSITFSGTAKDVAFQQCGANAADMNCRGTHDPMRPIANYVRVIDLTAPAWRHTGATNNPAGGGATTPMPGTFFQQVTPQQADVSQPWNNSLELYLTPWGFLKGAAANNATATKRGNFTVLSWSPAVKAPSGKNFVINGYVNDKNLIDHVET